MLKEFHQKLRRLTYWQWAKIGILAFALGNLFVVWRWSRSLQARERLRTSGITVVSESTGPPWLRAQLPSWFCNLYLVQARRAVIYLRRNEAVKDIQELRWLSALDEVELGYDGYDGFYEPKTPAPQSEIENACLSEVAVLPQLRTIKVHGLQITSSDLEAFARMPRLKRLGLYQTGIDYKLLASMAKARPDIEFDIHPRPAIAP